MCSMFTILMLFTLTKRTAAQIHYVFCKTGIVEEWAAFMMYREKESERLFVFVDMRLIYVKVHVFMLTCDLFM